MRTLASILFAAVLHVTTVSTTAEAETLPETVAPGAKLVEVFSSDAFHEGPTWDPKTAKLYFTAFFGGEKKTQRILRLDKPDKATVWLDKSEGVSNHLQSKWLEDGP